MSFLTDYFKTFLRELECPVCTEYMHTNISMCPRGHSICVICKSKCLKCPICQSTFGQGHNYVVENLISSIRIPCNYKTDGCNFQRNFVETAIHMKECEHRDFLCPFNKSHKCTWLGKCQKIKVHLNEVHKNLNLNYTFDIGTATFYMFHNKFTFKILRKFIVETGLVTWVVQFLGKKQKAKEFLFKIEFIDPKKSGMELNMTAECVPMCNDDDIFDNFANITFHVKMLEYFKSGEIYSHCISIHNKEALIKK